VVRGSLERVFRRENSDSERPVLEPVDLPKSRLNWMVEVCLRVRRGN